MEGLYQAMGLIFILGFCIQRLTDFADPFVKRVVRGELAAEAQAETTNNTARNTESELVTSRLQLISLFFAFVIVVFGNLVTNGQIGLLFYLDFSNSSVCFRVIDIAVTILFLSAGTDGANSAIKYLTYVKDGRKYAAANQTSVEIVPASATVQQGQKAMFSAIVNNNANQSVYWKIIHSNGGEIDSGGRYTAPSQAGSYIVMAYSQADPSKIAKSVITVV